jgi:plasmid maintenance system antidote protein VapI
VSELRKALERNDIPQALLAYRTGLTTKHVNRVVQGAAPLSVPVAVRIQEAFPSISAEELMVAQAREQVRAALEALLAPEQELADDYERNDHQ